MLTKWYDKPTTRTFPTFSVSNWFHTKKNAFLLLCSRLALSLPRDKSGKMKSPDGCRERPGFDTGLGNKDIPGYDSAATCSNP